MTRQVVITLDVYDDTDIFELSDELREHFGDTSEPVVYENAAAFLEDHFGDPFVRLFEAVAACEAPEGTQVDDVLAAFQVMYARQKGQE